MQRSAEDTSMMVATYEGEHNHGQQSHQPPTAANKIPAAEVGPVKPKKVDEGLESSPDLPRNLVEQMAASLINDPAFKSALAAAISGRMLR